MQIPREICRYAYEYPLRHRGVALLALARAGRGRLNPVIFIMDAYSEDPVSVVLVECSLIPGDLTLLQLARDDKLG